MGGMDKFLAQLRAAKPAIAAEQFVVGNLFTLMALMNSIVGVVNVRAQLNERLYRFVFGGEDGIMTHREYVRQDIWNAMVAEQIFNSGSFKWHQSLALLLTFCDDDVQLLVLDDEVLVQK